MFNQASLIGRLGADPEIRSTREGIEVATIRLATGRDWKDKNTGEVKNNTQWHTVVLWDKVAGIARQYLKKGSVCHVVGEIQNRKWTDREGIERYTTEIVVKSIGGSLTLLNSRDNNEGGQLQQQERSSQTVADQARGGWNSPTPSNQQSNLQAQQHGNHTNFSQDLDDDIPF
jgi:single-strand DNA-binding protein